MGHHPSLPEIDGIASVDAVVRFIETALDMVGEPAGRRRLQKEFGEGLAIVSCEFVLHRCHKQQPVRISEVDSCCRFWKEERYEIRNESRHRPKARRLVV